MIELYNNAGTESYGSFDKLKRAKARAGISCAHGRELPYHQNADTATDADTGGIA